MKTVIWRTILLLAAFFLVLNCLSGMALEKVNASEVTENNTKENTEDVLPPTGDAAAQTEDCRDYRCYLRLHAAFAESQKIHMKTIAQKLR